MPDSVKNNQLLKIINNRRSVRRFTEEPVRDEVFAAILEAGRMAPSTVNLQTWSFVVFDNDQWRAKFEHFIPFRGTRAVIILADTYRLRQILDVFPYSPLVEHTAAVINASLAAMNMNIAAEALGVSSIMLSDTGQTGLFNTDFLIEKLELPENVIPLMTMVFGYAKFDNLPVPPRLPIDQVVFSGTYKAPDTAVLSDWVDQMEEGFKAMRPGFSFARQVELYSNKMGEAEIALTKLVFYRGNKTSS
ncbi:MAG: hypothetical protein GX577_06915 [Leptolinea sp.]|nr:hypothetical protein [Leptolinea sp.]